MFILGLFFFIISIAAAVLGFGEALIAGAGLAQLLFSVLFIGFCTSVIMYYMMAIDYKNKI